MQPQQQTPVQQYASYLKSVYTRAKLPVYDKWLHVKSKIYINLALIEKEDITKPEADQFTKATIHGNIDDIKKSKRAMKIGQIAQLSDGSQPKCILVEGAPGVGKSTFAWKLCHKWGEGKLLQQYQLVVLLRLRDKSVRTAENISDLFRYHDHQIQQAAVEEIQRTGGKGVFLLFEGYDELPEELRTMNSIFLDVITGEELPEATVLITSRPWASEFLHRECMDHISQHIEILGFTKANIQSYLESIIPYDPSLLADLKKYISCYPHINSMMYIPLYCVFVVKVYQNRRDETLVPKTMTELYFSLVRDLLRCHYNDDLEVHSFNDLSKHAPDIYQQLCTLGKIAYEGIRNDQQVIFHRKDFETMGLNPQDFNTLGLMQRVRELYAGEETAVSYNFLHLTVQEYLAAFHLSQQPVEKQIEHFREYKKQGIHGHKQHHHFHMVLRFLCGITQFKEYSNEQLNTFLIQDSGNDLSSDESGNDSHVVHEVTFDTLHWLFEAQNNVSVKLLGLSDIQLSIKATLLTPFDCFVLGYYVLHSNCTWKINLKHWHIGYEEIEMLMQGAVEEKTHCTGGITAQNNDVIAKVLRSSDIQLHEQYGGVTAFECFVLGYCVSHSNCTWKIDLLLRNIRDEGVEMLVRGAVEEETHCTGGISKIDLMRNDITSKGVKHLLGFPKQLINKLETLNLSANKLDSESCASLANLIPQMPHLKKLELSNNPNIGQGGTVPLMTSLTAHNSLEELQLETTGIGVEDCQALSELLSSSTSLKQLYIGRNALPPKAVKLIISGLQHNASLERLIMWFSHFSPKNTNLLASVLKTNHTLVYLSLVDCDIDSDGACQLASALCINDKLQELGLCCNPVGPEGATAFAEMLLKNKSLKMLSIRDDSISEEGTQKLIDSRTQHNNERTETP